MFLHLSSDEKFIDSAHAAFERAAPGRHRFIVVDAAPRLRYIRTFEPERRSLVQVLDRTFVAALPEHEAIFLHSLNRANRLVVDAAGRDARFVWLGWGYDYYHLICAPDDLLLPHTRALLATFDTRASKFATLLGTARAAVATPSRIPSGLRWRHIRPGAEGEYADLQKIRFFAPVLPTEDALIRQRHPDFRPTFASWNYGVHDTIEPLATASPDQRSSCVVIGNNATPQCNHLDAFESLAGFAGEILCPLSYGSTAYRDALMARARTRFGNRFHALTEFMAVETYASLIAGSTHLVMNHLRQQGLANILMALCAGTRVVMRRANPLHAFLLDIGLRVDDIDDGLNDVPLDADQVLQNRRIVSAVFGAEAHRRRTRELLDHVSRA